MSSHRNGDAARIPSAAGPLPRRTDVFRRPRVPDTSLRLNNHAAIVTGASSGIGLAVAEALAGEGAAVAVNYRSHPEPADELVDRIRAAGGRAVAVRGRRVAGGGGRATVRRDRRAFGRVDVLVANSGVQKDAAIADMTLEDWNTVIDINLTGQFLCAREAVRRFRAQPTRRRGRRAARGTIIAMSSVHEVIPWAGHVNYAAAKGGVRHADAVAGAGGRGRRHPRERDRARARYARRSTRRRGRPTRRWTKLLRLIPYGRIGEPEDVARAAVWLASDEADYVDRHDACSSTVACRSTRVPRQWLSGGRAAELAGTRAAAPHDRRSRHHRRSGDGGAGRARRHDRLSVLAVRSTARRSSPTCSTPERGGAFSIAPDLDGARASNCTCPTPTC